MQYLSLNGISCQSIDLTNQLINMMPINLIVVYLACALSANVHTNRKTNSLKLYLNYNFFDFQSLKSKN